MKLLTTIKDGDINDNAKIRNASRAVLFDKNNLVPLLFVSKFNYHKLPGGGIEENESTSEGLVREVKEEVGAEIKIECEIGRIIEFRSEWNLKQTSYCYRGKIISIGEANLERSEIDEGFKLIWASIDEAISIVENDKPTNYEGVFIQKRDLTFLKEVKTVIQKL